METTQHRRHAPGSPGDHAGAIQPVCQGQKRGEVEQRVPGPAVAHDVGPVHDPRHHHERDHGEDDGRRVDPITPEHPEAEPPGPAPHHAFLERRPAHRAELRRRPCGDFLARADFGRVEQTNEQRQWHDQGTPTGRMPSNHRDQVISIPVSRRMIATASRFGARAVRKSELVTAVEAKAVHIR